MLGAAIAQMEPQDIFAPDCLGQERAKIGEADLIQHLAEPRLERLHNCAARLGRQEALDGLQFGEALVMKQLLRHGEGIGSGRHEEEAGGLCDMDGIFKDAKGVRRDHQRFVGMRQKVADAAAAVLLILCSLRPLHPRRQRRRRAEHQDQFVDVVLRTRVRDPDDAREAPAQIGDNFVCRQPRRRRGAALERIPQNFGAVRLWWQQVRHGWNVMPYITFVKKPACLWKRERPPQIRLPRAGPGPGSRVPGQARHAGVTSLSRPCGLRSLPQGRTRKARKSGPLCF